MTRRPAADGPWKQAQAELRAAVDADPLILEAIELYRATKDERHLDFGASRVAARSKLGLPLAVWRDRLGWEVDGRPIRSTVIPGIAGSVVFAIVDETDADVLRDHIAPGQVWVRADIVRSDDWPTVRAIAMDAVERSVGKTRDPGRRRGTTDPDRDALLAELREHPDMTANVVDALFVGHNLWTKADDDPERKAQRIRRARRDAEARR